MKSIRAALSVILCLVLLVSFSTVSYAKGDETMTVSIKTEKSFIEPGENVEATVSISSNYNAVAMRWFVLYSKSVFELAGTDGNFSMTDEFENVGGSVTCNSSGNVSYPEGYSSDEYGVILIQWVGGGENLSVFNQPQALDCFTFSLEVKDGVEDGTVGRIFIPDNSSYYNAALEDANDASTYYKAKDLVCTFVGSEITTGTPAAPQLLAAEGTDTVIDAEGKIIYGFNGGIGTVEDILACVTAIGNNAAVEIDPTEQGFGTGTVIRLVQNGVTVDSYSVVFFGDATGDGVVDESDFVMIDLYNAMLYDPAETSVEFIAMDCNRDGVVDESDLVLVDLVNAYLGEIDQVNGGIIFY